MNKNSGFWMRFCLAGSALMLGAAIARAQSAASTITFDALPRAHRVDSLRHAPAVPAKHTQHSLAFERPG